MSASRKHCAFTLVEMLVTVAIIVVLAALIIPTIKNSVEGSRSTKCVSNLRQIYTAAAAWSNDNDGNIVPVFFPWDPNSASSLKNWTGLLAPYLGRTSTNEFTSANDLPVAVCPSEPGKFGYGYNYLYLSWIQPARERYQLKRQVSVYRPSETVMFVDSHNSSDPNRAFSNWRPFVRSPETASWQAAYLPSFRHRSHANVLWLDGHVSAESANSDFWKDDRLWGKEP